MRPDLLVRRAVPEDAACLSALATQSWLHTYATEGIRPTIARYVQENLSPNAIRMQIDRHDAATFIAQLANHFVGYAIIEFRRKCPVLDAQVHLDRLFVQEHFLGRGVGSGLMQHAKAEARLRGDTQGLWLTVNSRNKRARAFYLHQDFKDVGQTYFDLYGESHENRILHAPAA